jgi:predicted nucleic acid-binding protein
VTLGLDTSVVVRLLVGRALDAGDTVVAIDLVLAEAYHALQHHYGMPPMEARLLLLRFARSGVVQVEPATAAVALVATDGAGLVDRLIHQRYRAAGAVTLTFDRRQGRLEGAVRLSGR